MNKVKKTTSSSYDTVFDFIFSVQQGKTNKPFRKVQPESGVYNSALIEIGTQPAIYPLESFFTSVNKYIESATGVDIGGGVKVGIGSGVLNDPGGPSNKEIAKRKAQRSYDRVGAGLHYGIDGALVSLLSRYNGASGKTAYVAGSLFADTQRAKNASKYSSHIFGMDTEEKDDDLFNRGAGLMSSTISRVNPSIERARIMTIIKEGQKITDRNERIRFTVNNLKLSGMHNPIQSVKIAEMLWGHDDKELGLYRVQGESTREKLEAIPFIGADNQKLQEEDKRVLDEKISKVLRSNVGAKKKKREVSNILKDAYKLEPKDAREYAQDVISVRENNAAKIQKVLTSKNDQKTKKGEIYHILKDGYNLESKEANFYAENLLSKPKQNNGVDIAEYAVYNSLVLDTQSQALAKEDYETVRTARESVANILDTHKHKKSLGTKVEHLSLAYNWIKESDTWSETFLSGDWEKLGVKDLNFTKIVEEKEAKDEDGKVIGKYFESSKTVMGQLIGKFYYLHPRNFIRGVFLEGDLLLKLATNKDGVVNKKSLAYLLYNARIGKLVTTLAKPMQVLANKFTSMLNPAVIAIKKFLRNVLKKVLGTTGVGGWLLMHAMDLIGDRITYIMNQIVLILLLGVIGILFVFLESTGMAHSNQTVELIQGVNNRSDAVVSEGNFTDTDFISPE